jgi:hypothetical protein
MTDPFPFFREMNANVTFVIRGTTDRLVKMERRGLFERSIEEM